MLACAGFLAMAATGADPVWSDRFYAGDFERYVDAVATMQVDGGARLFVGGDLSRVGGAPGNYIGEWDGTTWTGLNGGTGGRVAVLASYDDGTGAALFVGGPFDEAGGVEVDNIARWDGETWSPLGAGVTGIPGSMVVHDDGRGPSLFVGGFAETRAEDIQRIARWDGASWSELSSILPGDFVRAMASFDDGSGSALYAGGTDFVARWDGTSWTSLGDGLAGSVNALAGFDDGKGAAIYAAGSLVIDGIETTSLAKWTGDAWAAVPDFEGVVHDLLVHDDGSGLAMYVGGLFPGSGLRRFDGATWSAVAGGPNTTVRSLTTHGDGPHPRLVVGGSFTAAGAVPASKIAEWDGSTWASVGSENPGNSPSSVAEMLAVDADVVGFDAPALCVTGSFKTRGPERVDFVTRWDGVEWGRLGEGLPFSTEGTALGTFGTPPSRHLYAAVGHFGDDYQILRWNGTAWDPVAEPSRPVNVMREIEVAGERSFYAAGWFTRMEDVIFNRIARWDGEEWHALDTGLDFVVSDLVGFDDGSGSKLVAVGAFTVAGLQPANRVAMWDGETWSALGDGCDDWVTAIEVFDSGTGPELYVGGFFQTAGGVAASRLARWDGAAWSAVGSGTNASVQSLAVFDDGRGPALYVGGWFTEAGGVEASLIARYDGGTWEALGAGLTGSAVSDLAVFEDRVGPALYSGGTFVSAGASSALGIARWGCAACPGDTDASGSVGFLDVLAVVTDWGPCAGCPGDLTADAVVDFADLIEVLSNWGPCDRD